MSPPALTMKLDKSKVAVGLVTLAAFGTIAVVYALLFVVQG